MSLAPHTVALSNLMAPAFDCRRPIVVVALAVYLQFASVKSVRAEDHVAVKWQDYQEDDGRIRVISRYVGVEKTVTEGFGVRAHVVHDAISGATPTGSSGEDGESLPLSVLVEEREAAVVDFDWTRGVHKTSFQYAHSDEDDFLSRGVAAYNTSEFNRRNTGLSYGLAYVDDTVRPGFFDRARKKESWDAFFGVSQTLDPNTVASLNFTYSDYSGYLSDPYKIIRKETEVLPGLSLPLTFPENRPSERRRRIWQANVKRHFPSLNGSVDIDYRFFDDTWGVESHTFDVEWYQKVGDKLILRPSYRIYQQNGADFYYRDLDGTVIDPELGTGGETPHFSADYRLAKLHTESLGLKIVWMLGEAFSVDAAWERYEMRGEDADTPEAAFPDADILTLGGSWRF